MTVIADVLGTAPAATGHKLKPVKRTPVGIMLEEKPTPQLEVGDIMRRHFEKGNSKIENFFLDSKNFSIARGKSVCQFLSVSRVGGVLVVVCLRGVQPGAVSGVPDRESGRVARQCLGDGDSGECPQRGGGFLARCGCGRDMSPDGDCEENAGRFAVDSELQAEIGVGENG
jgi:hypothetical protein